MIGLVLRSADVNVRQLVLRSKALRLLAHVGDQFRPVNAFGKAGKILHQRGERKLASRLVAFNHQRASGWRARYRARRCVRRIPTL